MFSEECDLPRGVALFGSNGRREDYEVDLTIREARALAAALVAAASVAESP